MNLPLEYNKLSKYFDALGNGSPNSINRSIEKILKKYKVKKVLDLTCGTGSQIFYLAKRGYKVTGSNLSPNLLKIAKSKARKEKIKVKLLKGDMRTQQIGQFDAVITIFNAIGHLTKKDFEKAMQNINKNLKKGGLYVFDILNLNSMNKKVIENLKMDVTQIVGNTKIHHIQNSKLDKKNGRLLSSDYFSFQKSSGKLEIFKGKFALQIYTVKQLREMLNKNGFTILELHGLDGANSSERQTKEILIVAKKGR